MHHGCVRSRQRRRRGAAGWWPTSPSSRWAGRPTTPASWPPTTKRICPATARVQAGGTAPAPPSWAGGRSIAGRVPGHVRGPRPHHWGAARPPPWPQRGALPSTWSCGPTKSVSVLYGLGDPATGRVVPAAHHAGLVEAVGYLDGHLGARRGHAGHEHVSGQGCWRSGSITGRPERATRSCIPIWWWPTASRGRTAAGQPWTAGICIGIGWPRTPSTGPPTNGNSSGRSGWSGRRPTATVTGSWSECRRGWSAASLSGLARSTPNSTGWRGPWRAVCAAVPGPPGHPPV
jgi:hypothetical protein